jgi:hypothetical protein
MGFEPLPGNQVRVWAPDGARSSAVRAADSSAERRDGRDANPNKPLILQRVSGPELERENKLGTTRGVYRVVAEAIAYDDMFSHAKRTSTNGVIPQNERAHLTEA